MGRTAISKNPLRKNRILFSCFGVWGVFRKQQRGNLAAVGETLCSQLWVIFLSAVEGVGRVNVQISVKVFVRPVCCGETRAIYEKILSRFRAILKKGVCMYVLVCTDSCHGCHVCHGVASVTGV